MADISQISIGIVGNASGLIGAVGQAESALHRLGGAAGSIGGAFVGMAASAAKAALAVGAIGAGAAVAGMTSAVSVAATFEQQLSAIAAVSSKAEVDVVGGMKAISAAALELGKSTSFSATEAAAGMEEMVKAGVSLTDVMGGGAKAALDLAAAGALSVSEAATVASSAMNAFALSGKDLPRIVDTLANAASASATDVHQLGFGLASVGAVAHTVGLSFEDTTTAIAAMAQAGLKGSDAGTSLKTMLLNLNNDSKPARAAMKELGIITADGANQFFTAEGAVKDMAGIAGVLKTAMQGLTKEQQISRLQTIFGTDAIRAAAIMAELGAEGVNKLTEAQKEVGGASAVAKERLNNLKGAMEALGGSWEVIRIKIGTPFLPILTRAAQALTKAMNDAEPAISAFADRAAAGLDRLIARATAAGPRFLALGAGLLTFGRQGLALARGAIPKLVEGFEQIRGFLSGVSLGSAAGGASSLIGGLVGAFREVEPVVMSVGRSIVANITDTFTFLTTRVFPPLVSIIQQTGQALDRTLLPAAAATGAVLRGIFGDTLDWLAKTVWPPFLSIVEQTSRFFTGVILPTLPAVASALRTTLGESVQWLATTAWPALTSAATVAWQFISGTIIPALPGFAAQVRDVLGKAIEWVGTTGWPMFLAGATIAWGFLTTKVVPAVRDVISWLKEKLPPAIAAVTAAWETLKGKVGPIVEAIFNGDIKTAISKLGTAFSEFGTLALGWIKEQVAKIDWSAIWAASVDIAGALGTYLAGLAVDFAGWLGAQVALIPWEQVWNKAVAVFDSAVMWFGDAAAKLGTWIGDQVGLIVWADVWARATDVVTSMATWFAALAGQIATWIGDQAALIDWVSVWNRAVDVVGTMVTWFVDLAQRYATWIGDQVAKIPWATVWARVTGMAEAMQTAFTAEFAKIKWMEIFESATTATADLFTWLTQTIKDVDWKTMGTDTGKLLGGMFTSAIAETDWKTVGAELGKAFGAMAGTAVTSAEAWAAFKTGLIEGFVEAVTGASYEQVQQALGDKILGVLRGAWAAATGQFTLGPRTAPQTHGPAGGAGTRGAQAPSAMGAPVSEEEIDAYIREAFAARGHDPETAVRVSQKERINIARMMSGDQGSSFGPFQLHMGGLAPGGNAGPGMGDSFFQATGLDPRDINTWRQQVDYVAENLAQTGWTPFHAAEAINIKPRQGVSVSQPREQMAAPTGGGTVTYLDQWGNQFTVPEAKFNARPGGTGDVQVIGRGAAATGPPPGSTAGKPLYVLPIEGMGRVGPHWGVESAKGGTDIFAAAGTPIRSIGAGTVTSASYEPMGGWNVMVRGADGQQYYYAHMQDAPDVKAGQAVAAGQQIGRVGETGNAAGTGAHLHLGIGEDIISGTGAAGGTGTGFNAVGFLNDIVDGKYNGPIQETVATINQIPPAANGAAGSLPPIAENLQGVGAAGETAAPGITAGNEALGQTPVAAEAAVAGLGTVPPAVESAASGVAVGAETITAQFALMSENTLNSMTALGDGVLTTTSDMAGNTIATVTTMAGEVTNQSATLANGVSLNMTDMGIKVTTAVDQMAGTTTTTMTDLSGNTVTTVTNMQGQVVSQFATMQTESGSKVAQLASTTSKEMGTIASAVTKPIGPIDSFKGAVAGMQPPQSAGFVREFGKIGAAASSMASQVQKAANAVKEFGGSGEKSGDIKGANPLAKRAGGGWTQGLTLVGELGPELISPRGPVYVHNANDTAGLLRGGNDDDYARLARVLAAAMPKKGDRSFIFNGVTSDETVQRWRQIEAQERLLEQIQQR